MTGLIVDDTAILDDRGDAFGLDDDFEAPDGTRYVSDIHNPGGQPLKMVCAWMNEGFSLRVHMPWPGRDDTRSPREHALICPLTAAGVPCAARCHPTRRPAALRRKAPAAN